MIFIRLEKQGWMTKVISPIGNVSFVNLRSDLPGSHRCEAGYTIIEVLVALAILSFGILSIFNVFFNSVSAVRHLNNRMEARFILDEAEWNIKKGFKSDYILKDHIERKTVAGDPEFDLFLRVQKEDDLSAIYKLESKVTWREGRKKISLNRETLCRAPE